MWFTREKSNTNLTKANTKVCLSLPYNADNSYLFVTKKEKFKSKSDNKNANFPTQFCFGSILMDLGIMSLDRSLNGNV